ncbi:chaperonin 10-like protein [Phlyctochytrium arcticum]|nr:chaperonin 10-like protein [Phlyctochytrium arcticum]
MPQSIFVTDKGSVSGNIAAKDIPIPTPGPGQVVVKVAYAAINPLDYKMAQSGLFVSSFPAQLGIDFSGTIHSLGSNLDSHFPLSEGQQVFGLARMQAFSEYALANASATYPKPDNLSFDQAATLGGGIRTAMIGAFSEAGLELARPSAHQSFFAPEWVLVWGASSSTGQYLTQLIAAAGYSVIAVASTKNHELLRTLGAAATFDQSDPSTPTQIQALARNLTKVIDCIGGSATAAALASIPPPRHSDNPKPIFVSIVESNPPAEAQEKVTYRFFGAGMPQHTEFLRDMAQEVLPYIQEGRIQPTPVKLVEAPTVVAAVKQGLEDQAAGRVSAVKLVVKIDGAAW